MPSRERGRAILYHLHPLSLQMRWNRVGTRADDRVTDGVSSPAGGQGSARGLLLAVFVFALVLRVCFVLVSDRPILYTHAYTYFTGAMRIAEHRSPLAYVVARDTWRVWDQHWTSAPLYFVFAAGVFEVCGPHMPALGDGRAAAGRAARPHVESHQRTRRPGRARRAADGSGVGLARAVRLLVGHSRGARDRQARRG